MHDMLGNTLTVGDPVYHIARHGSSLWATHGVIVEHEQRTIGWGNPVDCVKIQRDKSDKKSSWIMASNTLLAPA